MIRKSKKAYGKAKEKPAEGKEPKKRFQFRIDFRRDVIGRVWLRLDYYDKRLMKLDDDKQKTFLDSYMQSTRQLNQSLFVIVIVMIIAYIAYAVRIIGAGETIAAWMILLYLLFYIARHHRNENEKLLEFLLDSEITPEYARKR
jgi:hypothetical protein